MSSHVELASIISMLSGYVFPVEDELAATAKRQPADFLIDLVAFDRNVPPMRMSQLPYKH